MTHCYLPYSKPVFLEPILILCLELLVSFLSCCFLRYCCTRIWYVFTLFFFPHHLKYRMIFLGWWLRYIEGEFSLWTRNTSYQGELTFACLCHTHKLQQLHVVACRVTGTKIALYLPTAVIWYRPFCKSLYCGWFDYPGPFSLGYNMSCISTCQKFIVASI